MKKVLLALFVTAGSVFALQAQTQVPNSSFEEGTGTSVDKWITVSGKVQRLNQVQFTLQNGTTATQTAPDGTYFMELLPDTFRNDQGQKVATPGVIGMSFPYTDMPKYLSFNTIYVPGTTADQLTIRMVFSKWNPQIMRSDIINNYTVNGPTSTVYYPWTKLSAGITYAGAETPDSLTVLIYSNSPSATSIGTTTRFYIDNFHLSEGNPLGIELKQQSILASEVSSYPNPMNQYANINYAITERANVKLIVTYITGREVANLVNESQMAGNHQVKFERNGLKAGVYIYRLQAGNQVESGKIIIAD
jgi:hypothetical protein